MSADHVPDQHGATHAVVGPHGSTEDHGEGHGQDDHAHAGGTIGPIDWPMWGVGVLGVIVGLIVTAAMVVATGFSFAA